MTQRKKVEDLRLLEHAYTAINDLAGEIDQECSSASSSCRWSFYRRA